MNAIEHLQDRKWTTPDSYYGFNPVGDFFIYSRNRDSDELDNSNYERIFEDLKKIAAELPEPIETDKFESGDIGSWVYDFSANHWACGWVEYILIRQDAPEAILQAAGEIICGLADYPVYDESDWCGRETEAANEVWANCYDWKERIEYIREYPDQFAFNDFQDILSVVKGKYFIGYANELLA